MALNSLVKLTKSTLQFWRNSFAKETARLAINSRGSLTLKAARISLTLRSEVHCEVCMAANRVYYPVSPSDVAPEDSEQKRV